MALGILTIISILKNAQRNIWNRVSNEAYSIQGKDVNGPSICSRAEKTGAITQVSYLKGPQCLKDQIEVEKTP